MIFHRETKFMYTNQIDQHNDDPAQFPSAVKDENIEEEKFNSKLDSDSKLDLNDNILLQPDGKAFCQICGIILSNMWIGKRHFSRKHQQNVPHSCQICNRSFKNKESRNQHQRSAHKMSSTGVNDFSTTDQAQLVRISLLKPKAENDDIENPTEIVQNDNEEETKALSINGSRIQKKKRKEIDMAITLIAISITFVLCQSVKLVADVYELTVCDHFKIAKDGYDPQCHNPIEIDVVISLGNLFVCVNSAANFLMYMIRGKKFREAFCQTYFPCWKKEENYQQNSTDMYQMTQRSSIH